MKPNDLEVHQTASKKVNKVWVFQCGDCSFEANFFPILGRFEVLIVGNPFVKHTCQTEDDTPTIREMIEELDLDMAEFEVEVEY